MLPTHHRSPLHRFIARAGLLAVLVLAVVALSRCQLVSDRLTGVSLTSARSVAGACIVECQKVANEAIRAESVLHVASMRACGNDPACRAAEARRHRDAVHGIQERRRECTAGCHHQGGGSGGH